MGIWGWMNSTAESVKRNNPIKNGYNATYSYSSAGFSMVDQAVRNYGPKLFGQLIPDQEARSQIGLYSTKFAKNAGLYALQEGYKIIPGGTAFSKIISNTMNEVKQEKLIDEKLNLLEKKLHATNKHSIDSSNLIGVQAEIRSKLVMESESTGELCCAKTIAARTPDDVIRVFMMKEFIGNWLLDDLMVPNIIASGKNNK